MTSFSVITCAHRRARLKKFHRVIKLVVFGIVVPLIICKTNLFLFYWSLIQCDWPSYESNSASNTKVMFITDIHLQTRSLWTSLDATLREWQMYHIFRTAKKLFKPDVIFVLGDIFDDGERIDDKTFQSQVVRFRKIFCEYLK